MLWEYELKYHLCIQKGQIIAFSASDGPKYKYIFDSSEETQRSSVNSFYIARCLYSFSSSSITFNIFLNVRVSIEKFKMSKVNTSQ
ncbi:hypothetical protein Trydic_g6153 [Trypoxylus dichotomus]